MDNKDQLIIDDQIFDFKDTFLRYLSFWPWFLISILIFISASYFYQKYAEYLYVTSSKIEIIDKSQDSEMALPTAMTIFNRSMINLENEIGVLTSHILHERVVSKLNSNVVFISKGRIKDNIRHPQEFIDDYEFSLKLKSEDINTFSEYEISIEKNELIINKVGLDNSLSELKFNNLSTKSKPNQLPFDLVIKKYNPKDSDLIIQLQPYENSVEMFRNLVTTTKTGKESDQLEISLKYSNKRVAEDYLNTLVSEFDKDGVIDRQLEYKRTIDFVDSRSDFLSKELEQIEIKKQKFKEENNLIDIKSDASYNVEQQYMYDAELFDAISQKDLLVLLKELIVESDFQMIPVNIGIENPIIEESINQYNNLIRERNRLLIGAGVNNLYVKNFDKQIADYASNISNSIVKYDNSLDIKIQNLKTKEDEFFDFYKNIPENEKILRSIERELEVKESLFILLLQKREEAAINFAVVRPSIKVIDYARSSDRPVSPNKTTIYFTGLIFGFFIPFSILFLWFFFDNKIHIKEDILKLIPESNIVGEIPYVKNIDNLFNPDIVDKSRDPFHESLRMIMANIDFISRENSNNNNIILVTSTIKGEGKTLLSTNFSSLLTTKNKRVVLVGSDLRNPQIHKFIGVEKTILGISDYVYNPKLNWKDLLIKSSENLDIILSGNIPPNPTQVLSSKKYKELITTLSGEYDYVVIDSAPCLLVSDTFEISHMASTCLYMIRANHTNKDLLSFISQQASKKINGINIILNGIGNSSSYGYKYGYQYGYQYGYKYGYNYGYGYGYTSDDS